jgi:hypothetical protein
MTPKKTGVKSKPTLKKLHIILNVKSPLLLGQGRVN